MSWLTTLFYWVATLELTCFVVLAVGVALALCWARPIERLRSIQVTFAAIGLACLLQASGVLPRAPLGWLTLAGPVEASVGESSQSPASRSERTIVSHAATSMPVDQSPVDSTRRAEFALQVSEPLQPEAATRRSSEEASTALVATRAEPRRTSPMRYVGLALLSALAVGALSSLLHLVPGALRLARIWRRSKPVPEALVRLLDRIKGADARGVTLRMSHDITVPVAFGMRRGMILLPESIARGADYDTLRYCLAHEWSHIRNFDIAQWWGVQLCQAALWCQPLFWLLRREMRVCQDQIADDFAARLTSDPLSYAQLLIDLARQSRRLHLAMALTMSDGRSSLHRRIRLLTDGGHCLASICRPRALAASALALSMAALAVALVDLAGAQAEDHGAKASNIALEANVSAAIDQASSAPATSIHPSDDVGKGQALEDKTEAEKQQATRTDAPEAEKQASPDEGAAAKNRDAEPKPAKALNYFGVVMDKATKEPIPGAQVTVRRSISGSNRHKTIEETKHTTNDKGVYRFVIPAEQVAEPMMYIELDVTHPDYASKTGFGYSLAMIIKNLKKGEPPFFTRVVLDRAEPVTGRIVDTAGKPLAGVHIQSYSQGPPSSPNDNEFGSFIRAESGEDGTFRLNLVKGGPAMMWIVPDDEAPRQLLLGTKKGDLGDVVMANGIATDGQVVDAEGKPTAGVWVNLVDDAAQKEISIPVATSLRRSAKTDAEGRFHVDPMKPGSYRLTIEAQPFDIRLNSRDESPVEVPAVFAPRTITISEPPQPIVVQAVPHVQFVAQYRNAKGENCRGHEFHVFGRMNGESYFARMRPDENGHVEERLPLGLEQAQLSLSTNEHSSLRARVAKDKPLVRYEHTPIQMGTIDHDVADVEIIRYVAPMVTLKVLDEEGHKVPTAKVAGIYVGADQTPRLSPVGGLPTHIFFEKQIDGRQRSSQMLPDEKTKFVARAEGYEDAEQELSLLEGEEKDLVLVLKRAAKPADADDSANATRTPEPKPE